MAVAVAVGYAARHAYQAPFVTHAHARVITARRAPHQHFPSPRARSACARCGGGGAHLLTRLRARGVAVAMAVAMVVGYVSRHAHHARRVSRARAMSSLRVARVINFPFPRCAIGTRVAAAAAALARSLARSRARGAWRWRWRWRWRSVTPRVTHVRKRDLCVTRTHARVTTARRARHQRFPFARARSARACCGGGGARSLARSRARGVALAMAMAMAVTVAVTVGYTARHVRCTSHTRTHASSPRMARAINVSLSHARSARVRCGVVAALARSLARSRARRAWRWRWRWRRRSVTSRVVCVMRVTCVIRLARVRRVITARHQRFPSELSLARDRYACAAAAVALARSLYCARGLAVAVAVAVGYDARQSCHAHHAVHALLTHTPRHRRASRASSPFPVPPTIGTRAAAVAALARSLSHARCGGGDGGGLRRA